MISRRRFIAGVVLAATPLDATSSAQEYKAQQTGRPVRTVAILAPHDRYRNREYSAFIETLRSLGYDQGSNLRLLLRSAEGKAERLPVLAKDLVDDRVEVIVAVNSPGARAAIQATKQIPVVMTIVGDPVALGFVSNLSRPGGNVTGISSLGRELAGKRLALVKEVVPGAKRIAAMFNPNEPLHALQMEDMQRAVPVLNVEIRFFPVKVTGELPETFKRILTWRADAALWVLGQDAPFQPGTIELAARHRLPTMVTQRENVENGGLMSYFPDAVELFRRTAIYVDRILKGAKPGDLPVELPTKFELVINAKTAKALGLTIPPSLLLRADQVIE